MPQRQRRCVLQPSREARATLGGRAVVLSEPQLKGLWSDSRVALSLGLKIARTPTQGSVADSVAGLEDTIPLGWLNHRSFRRSVRRWLVQQWRAQRNRSDAKSAARRSRKFEDRNPRPMAI